MTTNLDAAELARLYAATQTTLREWILRLRAQASDAFPEEVTAFRPEMAVHGKFRQPCPTCAAPVQRILHAENETNYCARCETGGRVLADRALSQLLRKDWPRTLEELEARRPSMRAAREVAAEQARVAPAADRRIASLDARGIPGATPAADPFTPSAQRSRRARHASAKSPSQDFEASKVRRSAITSRTSRKPVE